MDKFQRVRVPLAKFRNGMSRYIDQATKEGCVIQITKHGKDSAIAIAADDLRRIEALIEMLSRRALEALELEDHKAKKTERENQQVAKLVKKAVRQAIEGDPQLLHEMARKYLGL